MAAHNRYGNDFRQFGRRTMPFFDRRERLAAQGQAALILLEKLRDPRIEVPAEVIEARSRGQRPNFCGGFFLQMSERDHYVRDLHAGVIDVVLHFHSPARAPQEPHEGIAQSGIAQMPDVRGFIGIDVGVFDHVLGLAGLLAGRARFRTTFDSGVRRLGESRLKKCRAVEEEIDVPRAGQFHARYSGNRGKFGGDLLGDLARRAAEALGQFEGNGGGHFAQGHIRRPLRNRGNVLDPAPAQKFAERRADAGFNDVIHGNSSVGVSPGNFHRKK